MRNCKTKKSRKMIHTTRIFSDPDYQRPVDPKRVKRIADHFDPDIANPIKVSYRDGKYWVFDGQHTMAALIMMNGGEDLAVECIIFEGLTKEEEAHLFAEQFGISKALSPGEKQKARYIAGDQEIIELHDAIVAQGIKYDFSQSKTNNKIVCYSAILNIFQKTNCIEFGELLEIVKRSWDGDADSFRKEILTGMYIFCTTYKGMYDKTTAIKKFAKVSPLKIIRDGKAINYGGPKRFTRELIMIYNGRSKQDKRLDETLILY